VTRRGAAPRPDRTSAARARRALALVLAMLVAACTTVPQTRPADGGETLSGRLALHVEALGNEPARAFSAAFDLRGDPGAGTLGLATPLGSMLAQARWSAAEVVLVTPQGTRRFADLGALTREVLGESVPIEAWFDWLRGRPWPGAPSTSSPDVAHGFEQLGWRVDLGRFDEGAVLATRASPPPSVLVRIRLDRS
jgi:outer membrane lipoprotein LolB